jgi:cell division protein FtsB
MILTLTYVSSPIAGANDRIAKLRRRHQQLAANIEYYETRVAEQSKELYSMSRTTSRSGHSDHGDSNAAIAGADDTSIPLTKDDLEREDAEVRELERKKKALEERVEGMERDLGGLMR